MKYDLVSVGETMVCFLPDSVNPLRYVNGFRKTIAGAESNVCIGLSKLNKKTCWISSLGKDEFGSYIRNQIRSEGVDVSANISETCPTGIMFKQFTSHRDNAVFYYRRNSAASSLTMEDMPLDRIKDTRLLHLTGILPALSESCRETAMGLIEFANARHIPVSFDPNIRLKLWDISAAKAALLPMIKKVDLLLLGEEEADVLFGAHDPDTLRKVQKENNYTMLALKRGAKGSAVFTPDRVEEVDSFPVNSVDNIGAGDAFNAGFLYGYLEECSPRQCGVLGNAMGAFAVMGPGDTETLPDAASLHNFIQHRDEILR